MEPTGDPVSAGTLGFVIVWVLFLVMVYFLGFRSE